MVMLLEYIDAIARQAGHDVLFVGPKQQLGGTAFWHKSQAACAIIAWLDQQKIKWQFCGPIEDREWWDTAYIYVKVSCDIDNPQHQALSGFLDDEQGCCKWKDTDAWVLTLDAAMRFKSDAGLPPQL